jgi:hypothetical protein
MVGSTVEILDETAGPADVARLVIAVVVDSVERLTLWPGTKVLGHIVAEGFVAGCSYFVGGCGGSRDSRPSSRRLSG